MPFAFQNDSLACYLLGGHCRTGIAHTQNAQLVRKCIARVTLLFANRHHIDTITLNEFLPGATRRIDDNGTDHTAMKTNMKSQEFE